MGQSVRLPSLSALRALEAVVRLRSVTAAARDLQLSHPAISQALTRLEAELGVPLLSRSAGGPIPTEVARELISAYNELVARISRIQLGPAPDAVRKISVYAPSVLAHFWFSQIDAVASAGAEFHVGGDRTSGGPSHPYDIALSRFAGSNDSGLTQVAPERVALALPTSIADQGGRPQPIYTTSMWERFLSEETLALCGLGGAKKNIIEDAGVCLTLAEAHGAACLFDERVLRLPQHCPKWRIVEGASVFTGYYYGVKARTDVSSIAARHILAAWTRWIEAPITDDAAMSSLAPAPWRSSALG
jgi:hypothetical protein